MKVASNRTALTAPPIDASRPAVAVLTCAVLEAEISQLARDMPHVRTIRLLEQGLHNDPPRLRAELQRHIDEVELDPAVEVIVLGYGLCSRGTEGVTTRRCRLVIARAHDCITHLLGSKERYARYVADHPGTYWYSPGWNKHHIPPGKERYERLYRQYAEKYGEDNAEFLMEQEQGWFKKYDRATYVHITIGVTDQDVAYTRECADWLGWRFDMQDGDPTLLRDMLTGPWDHDRFAVALPGQVLRMTGDDRVVEAAPLE